jgi:capsular polysaccharide biosynthesis protein
MLILITILWLLVWALAVFDMLQRDWRVVTKVLWALAMLVLPVIGVIAYFVVRPPAAADTDVHIGATTGDELEEQARNRQPR